MVSSLRVRVFLMVFLVVAATVAVVALVAGHGTSRALVDVVGQAQQRDQHVAVDLLTQATNDGGLVGVRARTDELGQALGTHILVVDKGGQVLADSSQQLVGQTVGLPPVSASAAAPTFYVENKPAYVMFNYLLPVKQALPAPAGAEVIYFVSDAGVSASPAGQPAAGMVSFRPATMAAGPFFDAPLTTGQQMKRLLAPFNSALLLAVAAGAGVALLLTAVLSRRIVAPVAALTAAVRRMEGGDRQQRVAVRGRDEIGQLAQAFNSLADSVTRAEQLRRHMVNDIAHELRTPLTNIRGYLEGLRDGVVEARPEVVESLYEEAVLLNRLVDDLQDLALADAGQLRLQRQSVVLSELVEQAVAAVCPRHSGAALPAIQSEVAADLPAVQADPERVGQILRNLLTNALHHTPAEGQVTIAAAVEGEGVTVEVRDTGSGIAPEHVPYVFERFYRADPSRTRRTGGAGLGLAIVKQLVEAHGGRVWLRSAAGDGTTVGFSLPLAAAG